MTGKPKYPPDWATKFKALEKKVNDTFTAAQTRIAYTKVVAQLLTVGSGNGRIEIDPSAGTISFFVNSTPAAVLQAFAASGDTGTSLFAETTHKSDDAVPLDATATVSSQGYAAQVRADANAGASAQVVTQVVAAGAQVQISALGGTTDLITLWSDGDVSLICSAGGAVRVHGKALWIDSTSSTPAAASGGGYLYVGSGGALHYRGASTDTQIAPA